MTQQFPIGAASLLESIRSQSESVQPIPNTFVSLDRLNLVRRGWHSASARRLWITACKSLLATLGCQPFSPAAWITANLDLLHSPVPERDTPRLTSLSITNLKIVYHTMSTAASPEWQDYVWDTFTEMLERELALEA